MKQPQPTKIKCVVMSQTVENSEGFYVRTFDENGGYTETFTPHKKVKNETTNNNKSDISN